MSARMGMSDQALHSRRVSTDQRLALRRAVRGVWPHLPLLALSAGCVCGFAVVAALLAPGVTPVSVLLLAVVVTPAAVALGAVANDIVRRDDASVLSWCRGWRHGLRSGFGVTAPSAVCLALFVVAVEVWRRSGQQLLLVSVAVSGAVALLSVPVTAAALQLVSAAPELRGVERWRWAAALALQWPVRFVAAPVLLGLGLWIGTAWGAALLLLVPIPVTMVNTAALWTSVIETRFTDIALAIETDVLERNPA